MRKATTGLLVAAGLFAVAGVSQAADRAGVGLEWGMGPRISFGTFNINFINGTSLRWEVGNDFTIGVAASSGLYRAEHSYTDNTVTPNITDKLAVTGSLAEASIQVLHSIPGLSFLTAGLELGTVTYGAGTYNPTHSDGSTGALADFGAPAFAGTTAAEVGLLAKIDVLKAESKLVTSIVSVNAGLNFVTFADTTLLGTQEVNSTSTPLKGIDPVNGNTNLAITASVGLWF